MLQCAHALTHPTNRVGGTAIDLSRDDLVPLDSERTSLRSLVHHVGFVEHDTPLEEVLRIFNERRVDFLAITNDGAVSGVCSRLRLGTLLGSRFGFALYSRSEAYVAQVEHPLVYSETTPVREVLDSALARRGDEFHEDVVLVDAAHGLLGMIPVDALARLQSRLVSEQLAELRRQHLGLFQAQHALRQSHGLYLGLFENHSLGVALLDVHGRLHEHNRRLADLLKIDREMLSVVSLAAFVTETDRAGFLDLLRSHAGGGFAPATRELTLAIAGSGPRRFRCSFGWIRETGQICACLDDITEQKEMERHLMRQEKQTLLDTLVGGIAHELNNKLTPVHGFSQLIAADADVQTRQYADLITQSAGEAAGIIRQLLQLSKPVPGTESVQVVDLRTVAEDALSMLRFETREARCTVGKVFAAEPVWVRADPAQLKQVLINLALNAIQAMAHTARATLEICVRSDADRARVIVSDNGVGIPPDNLGRVFDPFFTTKGPEKGTGLGLSVCFSIVRQHGGEIAVESEVGAGARFTVSLPAESPAFPPLLFSDRPAHPVRGAALATGKRVLVVDDEVVVRRLIQEVLVTHFGCQVDAVDTGIAALDRLTQSQYSLVISDIRMPEMNGTELFLWLREAQPEMARRFIFVTGHAGDHALEAEIAQWGAPVLAKPFTLAKLAEACAPFLHAADALEAGN